MEPNIQGIESARFASLVERMPLQYGLAVAMMLLKIVVFANTAPWWILAILAFFCAIGVARGLKWARTKITRIPEEAAARAIAHSSKLVRIGAVIYVVLDVTLYSYGNEMERTFILVQLLLGCVCQLFYFVYMPRAAVTSSLIFIVTVICLTMSNGQTSLMAITSSTLMVLVCLAHVVYSHHLDFVQLVHSNQQLKMLGEENERLARTDALTDLPNRREFFKALSDAANRFADTGKTFAVGIADLDGFKTANDTFGHKVGDMVLATAAARMQAAAGDQARLYRLGGDEFAFITSSPMLPAQLSLLAEAMISSVHEPITHQTGTVRVACSIGIAMFPDCSNDIGKLFEMADEALYDSKHRGRGCVTVRSPSDAAVAKPLPIAS